MDKVSELELLETVGFEATLEDVANGDGEGGVWCDLEVLEHC